MNRINSKMLASLRENGKPVLNPDVLPEVPTEELHEYLRDFWTHPTPFVVRGYKKDCRAVKFWSADWFSKNYGDFLCSSSQLSDHTPQKLSSLIAEGNYVNFLDRIFGVYPELHDDLGSGYIMADLPGILGIRHAYNEMFLSARDGSGSGMHNHSVWNFFLQTTGRKKWTLVDPEFSHLVYAPTHTLEFGAQIGRSSDLEKFPLFEYCPRYEVTLDPGDLLFNPPMWWHSIDNEIIPEDDTDSVIGVTYKYYDSVEKSPTTLSDPRFNLFNEMCCVWRVLFLFDYAEYLRRSRVKSGATPDSSECCVQARLWAPRSNLDAKANRWARHWAIFRYLCLNDPEGMEY